MNMYELCKVILGNRIEVHLRLQKNKINMEAPSVFLLDILTGYSGLCE